MPAGVRFYKYDELPPPPYQPDALIFVKEPGAQEFDFFVTDMAGNLVSMPQPRLQMRFWSTGFLLPANQEFGRYLTKENLELDALLSGAVSEAPATADAVITVVRGVDLVARFTFPAGQSQAIPEIIMPTVPPDNLLIFRTPLTQDATLSGVTGTLGARRT